MDLLPSFIDAGSFGLVAYFVVYHLRQALQAQATTARILAELVLQVAKVTNANELEIRESARLLAGKER